jgi:hypothetical protein
MVCIVVIGYASLFHEKLLLQYTQDVSTVFYNEDS